jgi:hypothetical protein
MNELQLTVVANEMEVRPGSARPRGQCRCGCAMISAGGSTLLLGGSGQTHRFIGPALPRQCNKKATGGTSMAIPIRLSVSVLAG